MFWQGYPAAMPSTHGIWAVAVGTARVVRARAKLAPARRFNVSGMGQRYGGWDGQDVSSPFALPSMVTVRLKASQLFTTP